MAMTVEDRYLNDPVFHTLVDSIYHSIVLGKLTATEVRDAAMFAAIKYEQIHLKQYQTLPTERKG